MRKALFDQYLELALSRSVARHLYKEKMITRRGLNLINRQIEQAEFDIICPKQKAAHHPRKLTVIKQQKENQNA